MLTAGVMEINFLTLKCFFYEKKSIIHLFAYGDAIGIGPNKHVGRQREQLVDKRIQLVVECSAHKQS